MKKAIIIVILLMFLVSRCSKQKDEYDKTKGEESFNGGAVEQKQEESELKKEQKKELTLDDYKLIVVDCFDEYYQTTMDAVVLIEEKSFILWNPIFADGSGRYATPATVFQFKEKPDEIYNGTASRMIWKDGNPVQGQFEIGGGPMSLTVINGPINIRKEHSTESETIGVAENGQEYLAFESYDDSEYIWYKIYDSYKDVFAWVASDRSDPWVGIAV